jgi:polyisoprenoid-binding protein YceI
MGIERPRPPSLNKGRISMPKYLLAGTAAAAIALAGPFLVAAAPAFADAPAAAAQAAPAAPAVRAGDYKLDKSHAKILWSVSHFGFSTYTGEFTDFDARLTLDPARPERSRLTATIATPSVATHNDALDTHLRSADFFDAAAHPTATFVSTEVRPTGPRTADVVGNFTLRGVTRPLTLAVVFNAAGDNMAGTYTAGFSATGTIRRSEYGMTYAVPAVGDEIELRISGEFNPA